VTPVLVQHVVPDVARKISERHRREEDLLLEVGPATLLVPDENLRKIVEELVDNAF